VKRVKRLTTIGSFLILALLAALWAPSAISPAHAAAPVKRATPPAVLTKTEQIRGFTMQLTSSMPADAEGYIQAIDDLADMGCTWVNFSIAARQENVHSESIAIIWQNIPSQRDIERILRKAKSRGMGTMLMPIVLLNNSGAKDWRGVIQPPSWDNWFASYTKYITFMAHIAKSCDVDIFCVGSELLSTEPFRDRWIDTIGQIKQEFNGKLTYSANWDHYTVPTFWDQVDYIGMNNYNDLAEAPGAPLKDLLKAWEPIKKSVLEFAAKMNKPFMFTEVGWHNLRNTIPEPWNYVSQDVIDLGEQQRAFQSFVETWTGVPNKQFMGAFIWEWRPGAKPTERGSYSLQGSPSLEIVKQWMASR
jgi:hypothetical protein